MSTRGDTQEYLFRHPIVPCQALCSRCVHPNLRLKSALELEILETARPYGDPSQEDPRGSLGASPLPDFFVTGVATKVSQGWLLKLAPLEVTDPLRSPRSGR